MRNPLPPIEWLARAGSRFLAAARGLRADKRGNVLIMTGFAIIPLMFAVGFGIDYARAGRFQTKLNAAADAAALAAVDPALITQSDSAAQAAAQAMFDQQVTGLTGLTNISRTVNITSTSSGSLGTLRTVVVTYTARSTNIFGSFLKVASLPINGSATASASQPPSINFYLALDVSPSMLLPTSSTGIANLKAGAVWKGQPYTFSGASVVGCDFACHSNNAHQWNNGVYVVDSSSREILLNAGSGSITFYRLACGGNVYDNNGNQIGNTGDLGTGTGSSFSAKSDYCGGSGPPANPVVLRYKATGSSSYTYVSVNFPDTWWLAQNYHLVNPGQSDIDLRTDAQSAAAAGVIQYAYNLQQQYANANVPPVYKMQFYTFAYGTPSALTSPFGSMTSVSTLQSQSFPDLGAQAPLLAANTYWTSTSIYTGNADTQVTTMLNSMKSAMPSTSGTGTPSSPQNVLIIITDGLADDNSDSGITQWTSGNISQCTAIKNTGARIAILYTQYLPETINYTSHPTFNTAASNNVPYIAQQLQSCATKNSDGTYLMQTVSTDGSVSAALNTLFAMTVQSAKLIQ